MIAIFVIFLCFCLYTPITASNKSVIAKHINVHRSVKAFQCSECGKGFNFMQKVLHSFIRYFHGFSGLRTNVSGSASAAHEVSPRPTRFLLHRMPLLLPRVKNTQEPPAQGSRHCKSDRAPAAARIPHCHKSAPRVRQSTHQATTQ